MSHVLIVGGDGLIGRSLPAVLRAAGHQVTATSYRSPLPAGAIHLDLTACDPSAVSGYDAVVLAGAVVKRADCEEDPARAWQINVEAPVALGSAALAAGAHIVFLSTSIVLGGDAPYLPKDAPYAPFDAYSRQKAEAEQRLQALPDAAKGLSILRLTKVLDASYGVIAAWDNAAKQGAPITPFQDLVTAPVTVAHVTETIGAIITKRLPGIHHVSGMEHTYAEIARRISHGVGWPQHLLHPVEGRTLDPVAAENPPHSSLAADNPMKLDAVIEVLAQQLRTSCSGY